VSDRQPLVRPGRANEIWSMDFVFDSVALGRTIKCLAIVDDATHEAVALVPEHTIGGDHLTRIMDGICSQRGKPAMIRTDNGAEFTGRAMLTWAHRNGIELRLIEPGKPNQNAYVESFSRSMAACAMKSQRTLVHESRSRSNRDRELAARIQTRKDRRNHWAD
jgi:transposase InsO family protein